MTPIGRSPAAKISALISDVDGTLVTEEKVLTDRTRSAVAGLRAAGIAFAIVSSRPPRGLRMLLEPLEITTPIVGFNGGVLATPELSVIEQHLLSPEVARRGADFLATRDVEVWVFTGQDWLVRDSRGPYIGLEERTVQFRPTVVEEFGRALDIANKIVGVSNDFALLARCEGETRAMLADGASVARSQRYYLDITHSLANKGTAVLALSKRLKIPMAETAVIGDGANDIAMFERSGLSIAMGNAAAEVQRAADLVAGSYREEGFANAVERFILAGDRPIGIRVAETRDRIDGPG